MPMPSPTKHVDVGSHRVPDNRNFPERSDDSTTSFLREIAQKAFLDGGTSVDLSTLAGLTAKYGEMLPRVFVLVTYDGRLSDKAIIEICRDPHSPLSKAPRITSAAWQRFLQKEPSHGMAVATVATLLARIPEFHCGVAEDYSPKIILKNARLYAALFSALGDAVIGVMLDGNRAARPISENLAYFKHLADMAHTRCGEKSEGIEHTLLFFPYRRLDEAGAREALARLVSEFGALATEYYMAVRDSPNVGEAVQACIEMERALGGHAHHLFPDLNEEVFPFYKAHWPFFQVLLHRCRSHGLERLAPLLFEQLWFYASDDVVAPLLLKAAESKRILLALRDFAEMINPHRELLTVQPELSETFRAIAERGFMCMGSLSKIVREVKSPEYLDFVGRGLATNLFYGHMTARYISPQIYESDPRGFDDMVAACKSWSWAMAKAYRLHELTLAEGTGSPLTISQFRNQFGAVALEIADLAGDTVGVLLSHMPPSDWEVHVLPFAQRFRAASSALLLRFEQEKGLANLHEINQSWVFDSEEYGRVQEESLKQSGIRRIERYLSPTLPVVGEMDRGLSKKHLGILNQNLKRMNPEREKDKRLAIIVSAHYDLNNGFTRSVRETFLQLNKLGYKVILCEAGSGIEALEAVRKVVQKHRQVSGVVSKGAYYVGLCAHSNVDGMIWGDPSLRRNYDSLALDASFSQALRITDCLAEDSPIIHLQGCLLGEGGHRARNFGRHIREWNPRTTVIASRGTRGFSHFELDDSKTRILGAYERDDTRSHDKSSFIKSTVFF